MAVEQGFLALDAGNAWIKGVTDKGAEVLFPHALRKLGAVDVEEIELRGGSDDPNQYKVNGQWYEIGEQAIKSGNGAAKLGEARYTPEYYGVIAAITMHRAFERTTRVWLFGSHTPKDLRYRADLIDAVKRKEAWTVESCGVEKRFIVNEAKAMEEPVAAYRHATLGEDGRSYRGETSLRQGDILIVDIGGFTTAFARAVDGRVDYGASDTSLTYGMLDVLDALGNAIHNKYKRQLKGANKLPRLKLEEALRTGVYNGGMQAGDLNLSGKDNGKSFNLVDDAVGWYISELMNAISNYGSLTDFDGMMLAGGGGAGLEKFVRESIQRSQIYMADHNRGRMQFATPYGMLKAWLVLKAAGKV